MIGIYKNRHNNLQSFEYLTQLKLMQYAWTAVENFQQNFECLILQV